MPTPDASQYTQFRRYVAVSEDAIGSVGSKISPFNTSYTIPLLSASSQALFLPSANKEKKFGSLPVYTGAISLGSTITNPIVTTGGYNLFTFTPTENGWYRIIVDNFGIAGPFGIDMDLAVGYGNTPMDIPAVIEYDFADNYNDPPPESAKVLGFNGGPDGITSYFSAGCTYQVIVIGYGGGGGGTYTLTVRDNFFTADQPIVSDFYYTDTWQLYKFVAPSSLTYRFSLTLDGRNDSDLFVSKPDTELDIQGCIDLDIHAGPVPDSLLGYDTDGNPKIVSAPLISGSVYEVLVYAFETNNISNQYELSVSID
jgi:hypothetical protein